MVKSHLIVLTGTYNGYEWWVFTSFITAQQFAEANGIEEEDIEELSNGLARIKVRAL